MRTSKLPAVLAALLFVLACSPAVMSGAVLKSARPTDVPTSTPTFLASETAEEPIVVLEPNAIPMYWEVCVDTTTVHGSPRADSMELYILNRGSVVRVRELSRVDHSWAMIEPAAWVPMTDLCRMGER